MRSVQPNQDILTPGLETQPSHLLTLKTREEIEDVYRSPLPAILLSLIFLQHLGAALLSLGLTLVLGAAYVASVCPHGIANPVLARAVGEGQGEGEGDGPTLAQVWVIAPTFVALVGVHFALGAIGALARIGVHTASYVGLLVSLECFFAGLGGWGALV